MGRVKLLPHLLALMLCCTALPTPALAGGGPEADEPLNVLTSWADCFGPGMDPEKDTLPEKDEKTDTTEIIEKPDAEPDEARKPLTPEGNMTLVDDDSTSSSSRERQFLTITSRKGNYFYLIIDRANDGTENVHFLNQVDEADLLPLIETEDEDSPPAACSCTEKCHVGAINTACEICAVNMAGCVGKEPEPEPEPEVDPEPAKKGGVNAASIVLVILVAGGGAVYFLKFRKKKPDVRGQDDLDDYDYGSEDEVESENDLENEVEPEDEDE